MESFYDLCNDACSTYNRIKTISFLCNNKFDTWEPFGQFNSILFWISHSIHINLKHFHTSKLPFIVVLIWVPVAQDPESSNTGWMLKPPVRKCFRSGKVHNFYLHFCILFSVFYFNHSDCKNNRTLKFKRDYSVCHSTSVTRCRTHTNILNRSTNIQFKHCQYMMETWELPPK